MAARRVLGLFDLLRIGAHTAPRVHSRGANCLWTAVGAARGQGERSPLRENFLDVNRCLLGFQMSSKVRPLAASNTRRANKSNAVRLQSDIWISPDRHNVPATHLYAGIVCLGGLSERVKALNHFERA